LKEKELCAQILKLEYKIHGLKEQVTRLREALERKNRELDGLHYVWCSGGCESGTHRWTVGKLDEETVNLAVRNVNRMVDHFNASEFKYLDFSGGGGVKNRYVYIHAVQAVRDALEIGERDPAAAWDFVKNAVKDL
jgi:hypothetical protein